MMKVPVPKLEELVLRNIFNRIMTKLARHIIRCDGAGKKIEEIEIFANNLRRMLVEWIPPVVDSNLTSLLLQGIEEIYLRHPGCFQYGVMTRAVQYLVFSVIHPNVERMGPVMVSDGNDGYSCFLTGLPYFINKCLPYIRNLKFLNLRMKNITSICFPHYIPCHLVEFYGILTDSVLEEFINKNQMLRVLVLEGSRNVTDISVQHIASLRFLKVLDIIRTGITEGYIHANYPSLLNQLTVIRFQVSE